MGRERKKDRECKDSERLHYYLFRSDMSQMIAVQGKTKSYITRTGDPVL